MYARNNKQKRKIIKLEGVTKVFKAKENENKNKNSKKKGGKDVTSVGDQETECV